MDVERTPIAAPLPCYGLELDPTVEKCQRCPHRTDCAELMDKRTGRIRLSVLEFKLIPEQFETERLNDEDAEAGRVEELYVQCYNTIFGEGTDDIVSPYKRLIIAKAKEAGLSIRVFMLSCMFGYRQKAQTAVGHSDGKTSKFSPKRLTADGAVKTAKVYVQLCRKMFGAFAVTSLSALTGEDLGKNDFEQQMLNSEITAGTYAVGWKLRNAGRPEKSLIDARELDLNPYWLATEAFYRDEVLKRYVNEHYGSQMQRRHRSAVIQVINSMKRRKSTAKAVFYARQRMAPEALKRVMHFFGYRPDDFEIENEPVTNMMNLWMQLSRGVQHMEAIRYVDGEPSLLDRIFTNLRS